MNTNRAGGAGFDVLDQLLPENVRKSLSRLYRGRRGLAVTIGGIILVAQLARFLLANEAFVIAAVRALALVTNPTSSPKGSAPIVLPRPTPAVALTVTPSPTPSITPTSTATPSATPTPTLPPPGVRLERVRFACAANDYIDIRFRGQGLPPGYGYWAFALPHGQLRWYPSDLPIADGSGGYRALVYTGPATDYDAYVLLLPESSIRMVRAYVEARKVDGRWWLGLADEPPGAIALAEQAISRDCHSR